MTITQGICVNRVQVDFNGVDGVIDVDHKHTESDYEVYKAQIQLFLMKMLKVP